MSIKQKNKDFNNLPSGSQLPLKLSIGMLVNGYIFINLQELEISCEAL